MSANQSADDASGNKSALADVSETVIIGDRMIPILSPASSQNRDGTGTVWGVERTHSQPVPAQGSRSERRRRYSLTLPNQEPWLGDTKTPQKGTMKTANYPTDRREAIRLDPVTEDIRLPTCVQPSESKAHSLRICFYIPPNYRLSRPERRRYYLFSQSFPFCLIILRLQGKVNSSQHIHIAQCDVLLDFLSTRS